MKQSLEKEIENILKNELIASEICYNCNKETDDERFICTVCKNWCCIKCESKEMFICNPCFKRNKLKLLHDKTDTN